MGYYNPFPHLPAATQQQLVPLLSKLNKAIEQGATSLGAIFVPTADAIGEDAIGYLPNPNNIHPNEKGYHVLENSFWEYIAKFSDVGLSNSHYDGVHWLAENGIVGYPDGTFGVGQDLTRPHAAIMFTRSLGLDISKSSGVVNYFEDVYADDSYAEFIAAVGEEGTFKGSNGNFLPDNQLTREQMASTLVNAFDLKSDGENVNVNLKNVSPTHQKSVQTLANLGITNQLDDFRPSEAVTRGQFATLLSIETVEPQVEGRIFDVATSK